MDIPQQHFIISDIDGTLVPHPYHSGLSQAERNPYVHRLSRLLDLPTVACVTGRGRNNWNRLWSDAGLTQKMPRLAGLEFGAEVYLHGKAEPYAHISAQREMVLQELKDEIKKHDVFRSQADPAEIMSTGRLSGYYIEEKHQIAQIDWSFATPALNLKFAEIVFGVLNPHLVKNPAIKAQVFHQRIDVLERHFIPKAALSAFVQRWVEDLAEEVSAPICHVFGDELYDDYLFSSIQELQGSLFSEVHTIGVLNGNPTHFQNADRTVASPDEVWAYIEHLVF